MVNNCLLKTVRFVDTKQWNVKHFFATSIISKYSTESIGKHTIHITEKTKLSNEPEKEHKILGISNEKGMFDAYVELGKNINQAYIYVENGYLAYNPYRINVGSIGLKTDLQKNDYISPAYVVFKCRETLLPEFLYLVLKSTVFNSIIRENTTGSVRQTLSYDKLATIKIPIPSLEAQKQIVDKYNKGTCAANSAMSKADELNNSIDLCLSNLLQLKPVVNQNHSAHRLISTTTLKNLVGWGAKVNSNPIKPQELFKSMVYENMPLEYYCEINPKTIYPDDVEDVSFIPMECVSDIYGEIIEHKNGKSTNRKGYTSFQENDVIWAKITPCMQNGKCAVATDLKNGYAYGSTEFHVFRATKSVLPEYIHCFMRSKRLREAAMSYFTGSAGQQRVGTDFLEALTLPLLPIHSDNPNILTQETVVNKVAEIRKQIKELHIKAADIRKQSEKEFEEAIFSE
ncbi:EcoKI restriction-modification system protein HsdS [uncultured Ruminococcus sp.]|nr:EcoKI restriction-modification system protein HsdS [uncultured Clostridium sp.]SCI01672.1 EcoKI restriction-modification system protein HsdS [uncultured Ruminococcus sp.]